MKTSLPAEPRFKQCNLRSVRFDSGWLIVGLCWFTNKWSDCCSRSSRRRATPITSSRSAICTWELSPGDFKHLSSYESVEWLFPSSDVLSWIRTGLVCRSEAASRELTLAILGSLCRGHGGLKEYSSNLALDSYYIVRLIIIKVNRCSRSIDIVFF